jgi:hypothetical protein
MADVNTSFGFNMGAKMSNFGIVESNSAPAPPVLPQPKYLVLYIEVKSTDNPSLVFTETINTTGAVVDSVSALGGAEPKFSIVLNNAISTNLEFVYVETYFQTGWYQPTSDQIPLFQVEFENESVINLKAITYDAQSVLVDGYITLGFTIFEV